MDPQILEKDIISLLGLENLPEEEKTVLIAKMTEVVTSRITLRLLDILEETDKQKFNVLLRKNASPEEVNKFLSGKIKNLDAIQTAEILKFKQEIAEDAERIKEITGK